MKQYKLQMKNHVGPSNPTRDVYPCRLWRAPDPDDQHWPVVVVPTNGSILKSISMHHQDPEVRDLISEQMRVQEERLARLTETCLKHSELSIHQYINLVWDTSRTPPLVYCPVYKVALTTWMAYLLRLAHVNDDNTDLDVYNKKTRDRKKYLPRFGGGHRRMFQEYKAPKKNEEKNKVFKKSLRFIVVRHPFTRLLSAYRDKIETLKPKPFVPYFLGLQQAIILKYRMANGNVTSDTPTFSEFVDYVIDSTKNLTTAEQWHEEVVCWTPYWVQCGVCASDYQVIIKLETMAAEEQFLAQVANLKEIENIHEWRNLKKAQVSSAEVVSQYYKTLTKKQIMLLYECYKLDFDLFGYSFGEHLNLAKER
ncbi:carbohydrate sulfotransferase 11-like [Panulirus ornatus]|uniref:carbohydrate sulfotransferase 11-like n=1 Tax=Panulirus ornatus TaxID=150431 RepID=UPI003A87EFF9